MMKNKLKFLRESNNLSQEEIGRMLNVSRQTIISIEKGKFNPSLQLAFKISKIFNFSIEDIFDLEGDN